MKLPPLPTCNYDRDTFGPTAAEEKAAPLLLLTSDTKSRKLV